LATIVRALLGGRSLMLD